MVSSLSPSFLFFKSCLFLNIFNCLKLHTEIINFYLFLGKLKIFVQTQFFIHYFYSSFHLVLNTTCSGGNFSSFLTDKNTLSDSEWFRSSLIVGLEPLLFQNQGLNPSLLMWCIFFYHIKLSLCFAKSPHVFGWTSRSDIHFQCSLQSCAEAVGITATVPSVTSAIEAIDVSLERSQREDGACLVLFLTENLFHRTQHVRTHAIGNTYNTTWEY